MIALEPLMPPHEIAGHPNRTLALDVPHYVGNQILRWNPNYHMHVIRAHMPFQDLTFPLLRQLVEHFAKIPTNLAVEHLSPTFRDENDVVLAIPFRMI